MQTIISLNHISATGTRGQPKPVHVGEDHHKLDDTEKRDGVAESALRLHTRNCASASKGLTSGEIIQVPKPSSSLSVVQESALKLELISEPPVMNLLEQKRAWN